MGIKQLAKLLADEAPEVSAVLRFHTRMEMEDITKKINLQIL